MEFLEKFCPVCKNKNSYTATVCKFCGALLSRHTAEDATTRNSGGLVNTAPPLQDPSINKSLIPVNGIAICIEGVSEPIAIRCGEDFIIGRRGEDVNEVFPASFVDLAKWDAFATGMSRRHVMIRSSKVGYEVIDLSSTNGSWLNDERLIPNKPYPVTDGAHLRMGRMRILFLCRSGVEDKANVG